MIRFDEWLKQDENKYQIVINVTADRKLTTYELDNLCCALQLQVVEPVDLNGEDESWRCVDSKITVGGGGL
jgi:hypothetical protein